MYSYKVLKPQLPDFCRWNCKQVSLHFFMTRNTCFLYKLRCTSYGNTAGTSVIIPNAHGTCINLECLSPPYTFKWRSMFFISPLLSYTHVVLCLNAKFLMLIKINIYTTVSTVVIQSCFSSSHLHPLTRQHRTNLLTDRSQTNQRVQEIHHTVKPV
jgi:hypothetical protein